MKTIIERGASWTLEETKLLLALWGQDLIQRQSTNAKRSKEVYEKISEKFTQNGFERTPDQVRTRVFNMIAEYRRILKDPNPERMKKCIFYEPLDKIYHAKSLDEIKAILDEYEPEFPCSPSSNAVSSEKGEESITDGEEDAEPAKRPRMDSPKSNQVQANQTSTTTTSTSTTTTGNSTSSTTQGNASDPPSASSNKQTKTQTTSDPVTAVYSATPISSSTTIRTQQSLLMPQATVSTVPSTSTPITKFTTSANNNTPSYININSTKLPIIRTQQLIGNNGNESINLNGTATRLPTTAAISHQLYQAPVNTFDVTSSALLIDRMFAHLSRESENMREWIALEKERLAIEKQRRQQETEREFRRERALMETLTKFQDQWLSFLSRLDPRIVESLGPPPSEPQEATEPPQPPITQNTATYSMLSSNINNNNSTTKAESEKNEKS